MDKPSKKALQRRRQRAELRRLKMECGQSKRSRSRSRSRSRVRFAKEGPGPSMAKSFAAMTRPRRNPRKPENSQSEVKSGTDVIGTAEVTSSDVIGTPILRCQVNPRIYSGTRMSQYAGLYVRWRPKKLVVEIIPTGGMQVSGGYAVAWNPDPLEVLPAGSEAVQRVGSMVHVMGPMVSVSSLRIPMKLSHKWYLFDGDVTEQCHGTIYSILTSPIGSTKISIIFKLHWTLEFDGVDAAKTQQYEYIQPENDYAGIFTDSVSDWASGGKLTFKHSQGGSVVPWIGVRSNVLYTPGPGVKIQYYDSASKAHECKWFAKIIDSGLYDSALCCFGSRADALEYIKKGSVEKVLAYTKAGPECVPDLPTLVGEPISNAKVDITAATLTTGESVLVNTLRAENSLLIDRVESLLLRVERLELGSSSSRNSSLEVLEKP